jgi:hypothetical protein
MILRLHPFKAVFHFLHVLFEGITIWKFLIFVNSLSSDIVSLSLVKSFIRISSLLIQSVLQILFIPLQNVLVLLILLLLGKKEGTGSLN